MSPSRVEIAGYAVCERITRRHGTTYYWGARLLPAADRRHVYALYALARSADDIVDRAGPREPAHRVGQRLTDFEARFWDSVRPKEGAKEGAKDVGDPLRAAVARTVRECGLREELFARFFAAMRTDLVRGSYDSWHDLLGYMDGSAAVIGEMMLPVLRPTAPATEPARALGLAFQLTNFLRDVVEDLERGRVYLPQDELRGFGVDLAQRRVTPAWREFLRFQISRNRRLYRLADEGLALLPGRSRRCVATARLLYARILDRIEDADYDVFSGRLAVPTSRKAATAARMIVARHPEAGPRRDRATRAGRTSPAGWGDDGDVVLLTESGEIAGSAPKSEVHHDDTPLHLAFSCYVFDDRGDLLVTRRATTKRSFPGVVTNSVCGHPAPGEDLEDAVRRRARDELGIELADIRLVLPRFRYRALMGGIVEHEWCPVVTARISGGAPRPDPAEVQEASWVPWRRFRDEALGGSLPELSPWCRSQLAALDRLGDDPRGWPGADPAELPPAALSPAAAGITR